jgi:hypothetical protein
VDTEEECLALKAEIEAGKDFAEAAKEHSNCPSNAQGGDLGSKNEGWGIQKDQIPLSSHCYTANDGLPIVF